MLYEIVPRFFQLLLDYGCLLYTSNPDLNPQHVEDKDMILDIRVTNEDGEICDVEMQNSSLDQEQYQRFQIYGARLLVEQQKRGDDYVTNIHHVFQLIFIDDLDKDNLVLIDRYICLLYTSRCV